MIVLQVIDPHHPLPSRAAQRTASQIIEREAGRLRLLVTVPLGDTFRAIAIRTLMRVVNMTSGYRTKLVTNLDEASALIDEARGPRTPPVDVLIKHAHELLAARERSA